MLFVNWLKDELDIEYLIVLDEIEFYKFRIAETEIEARDLLSWEYFLDVLVQKVIRLDSTFSDDSEDCRLGLVLSMT